MKLKRKLFIRIIPLALAVVMMLFAIPQAFGVMSATDAEPVMSAFSKSTPIGNDVIFTPEDFTSRVSKDLELEGIFITSLPDESAGVLTFGKHTLLTGEAIETANLGSLRFKPASNTEISTSFSFIPIFKSGVSSNSITVGINVLAKENRPPIAENIELTTYKNIALTGQFKAVDPEGDMLTFKVTSKPKRGEIVISDNDASTFKYTPFQNKTGKETLEYIAIDSFGNESEPAKIIININKPSTKTTYADMNDNPSHYAAIRLIEEGVFVGETIGGKYFFNPDQTISRGEFVAMTVNAMDLDKDLSPVSRTGFADDDTTPTWVKPYALTALKNGIINGIQTGDGRKVFRSDYILTRGEAAVIINNALRIADVNAEDVFTDSDSVPTWAYQAVINVNATGIMETYNDGSIRLMEPVTRAQAAEMLCSAMELRKASEKKTGLFDWLF